MGKITVKVFKLLELFEYYEQLKPLFSTKVALSLQVDLVKSMGSNQLYMRAVC